MFTLYMCFVNHRTFVSVRRSLRTDLESAEMYDSIQNDHWIDTKRISDIVNLVYGSTQKIIHEVCTRAAKGRGKMSSKIDDR